MRFWALSACSCFSSDDCCGCPCWSTAPGCSDTQQTSLLLLEDPAELLFCHHVSWLSWMMLHLPQEQKPRNVEGLHPLVVDTHFKHRSQYCTVQSFWSQEDPLCLAEDIFFPQITSFSIDFTEVSLLNGFWAKDGKGTGNYDVVFPLWALLCVRNCISVSTK